MKKYGALEAGGTKMVCALGLSDGTILDQTSIPTTTPEETVDRIADYFRGTEIVALGVATFGPVDVKKGSSTYGRILNTPKLAWQNYDLLSALKQRIPVPMEIDTDVNGSCLGELTFGCAKGLDSVIYITIGTGVGVGIAINGQLKKYDMHATTGTKALKITDKGVLCEYLGTKPSEKIIFDMPKVYPDAESGTALYEADSVIYAVGQKPLMEEADALREAAPEFHAIGDCIVPKDIWTATSNAYYIARDLGRY